MRVRLAEPEQLANAAKESGGAPEEVRRPHSSQGGVVTNL